LELAFNAQEYDEALRPYVRPVIAWQQEVGLQVVEREKRLVNLKHGFAGTSDLLFRYGKRGIGILDFKTRKTFPEQEVEPYDGQSLQLAGYAATYWGEELIGKVLSANIFISTTEPGRMVVFKHEDVAKDWRAFKWIAALWRYFNNYDPRKCTQQI
jgi:RecB family exonuclease